jgi:hypothetical protein
MCYHACNIKLVELHSKMTKAPSYFAQIKNVLHQIIHTAHAKVYVQWIPCNVDAEGAIDIVMLSNAWVM